MKNSIIVVLVLSALLTINSCKKGSNGQINTPPPAPAVSITQSPLTVLLPNNCPQQFTISNTGPQGSVLNYTVADDGALKGFLSFGPFKGSLKSGASVTISVNINPSFVNANPSLIGATLILNVYTPNASNFTKIPVSVNIKSINTIAPSFAGTTWGGTWAGKSVGFVSTAPVSGTWTLNLQSLDTVAKTATGSLTWNGTDVYWSYVYDNNGVITSATPNPFVPNRTIKFNAANATFNYSAPTNSCSQSEIYLTINAKQTIGSVYNTYGPSISANFDINSNMVDTAGFGFETHPYSPDSSLSSISTGKISGKKQ